MDPKCVSSGVSLSQQSGSSAQDRLPEFKDVSEESLQLPWSVSRCRAERPVARRIPASAGSSRPIFRGFKQTYFDLFHVVNSRAHVPPPGLIRLLAPVTTTVCANVGRPGSAGPPGAGAILRQLRHPLTLARTRRWSGLFRGHRRRAAPRDPRAKSWNHGVQHAAEKVLVFIAPKEP